jgi:hypothetical protein
MIARDRRHHQDRVRFLRIERAMGDIGDREILDRLPALELEVAFGKGLVRRLLRRVGGCRPRQREHGGKSGKSLHDVSPWVR